MADRDSWTPRTKKHVKVGSAHRGLPRRFRSAARPMPADFVTRDSDEQPGVAPSRRTKHERRSALDFTLRPPALMAGVRTPMALFMRDRAMRGERKVSHLPTTLDRSRSVGEMHPRRCATGVSRAHGATGGPRFARLNRSVRSLELSALAAREQVLHQRPKFLVGQRCEFQ
jgi:hypothetical protein